MRFYTGVIDASEGECCCASREVVPPSMQGYFPGDSLRRVLTTTRRRCGLKLSLLDRELGETLRADRRAPGQVILTGDDYNFAALIEGGAAGDSPSAGPLGGPFSGSARHLRRGRAPRLGGPAPARGRRRRGYRARRCDRLGRVIFEAPVQRYKSGIAFLAWLNGLQENRMLANHEEHARSLDHLRVAEAASGRAPSRTRSWPPGGSPR